MSKQKWAINAGIEYSQKITSRILFQFCKEQTHQPTRRMLEFGISRRLPLLLLEIGTILQFQVPSEMGEKKRVEKASATTQHANHG